MKVSASQLQSMIAINSNCITELTDRIKQNNTTIKHFYQFADKETPEGAWYFNNLNKSRNKNKLLKKALKNLEANQFILKQLKRNK